MDLRFWRSSFLAILNHLQVEKEAIFNLSIKCSTDRKLKSSVLGYSMRKDVFYLIRLFIERKGGYLRMIRLAVAQDVSAIQAIYSDYVLHDTATFEYDVPSLDEFRGRMEAIQQTYPYLVYEENGVIKGYAYAHQYKERAAYQWDVELSVYISKENHGKGIGSKLYEIMFILLKKQQIHQAYACITSPNPKSERMHERLGFQLVGRFHHTGYKFGKWLDVIWMEKELIPPHVPQPVLPLSLFAKELPKDLSVLLEENMNA